MKNIFILLLVMQCFVCQGMTEKKFSPQEAQKLATMGLAALVRHKIRLCAEDFNKMHAQATKKFIEDNKQEIERIAS